MQKIKKLFILERKKRKKLKTKHQFYHNKKPTYSLFKIE